MKTGLFYPNKKDEINSVKITEEAFYKINLYASIVSEIIGSNKECGGELLNYKNRYDNIIRDIGLWNQNVTGGEAEQFRSNCGEYEIQNLKDVGIWHSHGENSVYHSKTDFKTLTQLYKGTINKVPSHDSKKSLEYVLDGLESIKVVTPEGHELVIEGDVKGIKYIKQESNDPDILNPLTNLNRRVFNSIVINKNSYSGGYTNPRLNHDYDAEVWVGYSKGEPTRKTNIKLETVDEKNNIQLNEEELVKEIGEKVKYQNTYLKDLPKYKEILEKYTKVKDVKNQNKPTEQIVDDEKKPEEPDKNIKPVEQIIKTEEKPKEKPDLTSIVQEQINEPIDQGVEHDQELHRKKTYMERLEDFHDYLNMYSDSTYKLLAELCRVNSGKLYHFWDERYKKSKEILKKIQKKNLTPEQKCILGKYISDIIKSNKYLKRNHPFIYKDLQRRLDPDNSNFYCNIAYYKDKLSNSLKSKKRNNATLEEKIGNTNQSTNDTQKTYKKTFGNYLKNIAKYVGIAALATAMVILPAKYCQKNYYNDKPAVVYSVKKGDNLWNLTKDYLKKNKVKIDNKTVYKAVDKVAENNGKGKQAEYKIGGKEKKNPHLIKPGEKIIFSKKVLDHAKQGVKNEQK